MNLRFGAASLFFSLTLALLGCGGGEDDTIPNQSDASRAILEKVRADMEKERLQRLAAKTAAALASVEASPTAKKLAPPPVADESDAPVVRPAAEIYAANCASCHGAQGNGDGPASAGLQPTPAKHSDGVYMNALSNEHLAKVIKEGGAAVGKSGMMAPWGSSISDEEIKGLVAHLRSLANPAYDGPMP